MAQPTKKELLAQAEAAGIEADESMTNAAIQELLDNNAPARLGEEGDSVTPSQMATTESVQPEEDQDFDSAEPLEDEDNEPAPETPVVQKPTNTPETATDVMRDSKVEREGKVREMTVKKRLAKEPRVRMFIPLGIGEKKNAMAYIPVTINGYRIEVPKGEYVNVPQSVADILAESQNQTVNAGNEWKIDLDEDKQKALS